MENKFKLNESVMTSSGKSATIIGIDTQSQHLKYLIEIEDDDSCAVEGRWVDMCNEKVDTILQRTGRWIAENELIKAPININTEVFVRRFKSGAVRSDDRGRENPSYISPYALLFLSQHFSANAAFFNDRDSAKNYMKGIEPCDIEASLERHMLDFKFAMLPNRNDKNAVKKALVEIMANCVMGLHQIGMEENGEYKEVYEKTEYIKKEA